MSYIVDVQGFKQPVDDYVAKELAIIPLFGDGSPTVFLFAPPFPWRRLSNKYRQENTWLERYYHGLSWNSGTVPYEHVGSVLREHLSDATKIYVLGSPQKRWLERFKFKVQDVGELGNPPFDKIKKVVTVCPNHNGWWRASCALHNAKLIRQYVHEYSEPLSNAMECEE